LKRRRSSGREDDAEVAAGEAAAGAPETDVADPPPNDTALTEADLDEDAGEDESPAVRVDPELVEAAAAGDEDAFSELVRLTHAEMYGLAYRLLGNEDDARDVVQEAYLRVYRALPKFRGEAAFTTWLYRITANAAYTYMRRRGRQRADSLEGIEEPESQAPRPEEVSQNLSLREALSAQLQILPPEQRAVVVMKDVYDLPHDVIAKELGISVTAAKVRLHRARKRLRTALEAEGTRDAVS